MSPSRGFKPPEPEGEPFRGNPSDPVPFATEGAPAAPANDGDSMTPWMTDSAFPALPQGPPSHSGAPPSLGDPRTRPQFRPAPVKPKDPATIQAERLGRIGLFVGVASIMISPLLGPVAIVLGVSAIRRGERKLGTWALSTGVAGTLLGIIVAVLVLTGVIDPNQILQSFKNRK